MQIVVYRISAEDDRDFREFAKLLRIYPARKSTYSYAENREIVHYASIVDETQQLQLKLRYGVPYLITDYRK